MQVDACTDGLGPIEGNSHCDIYYSLEDSCFSHSFAGKSVYVNGPFTHEFFSKILPKMDEDFMVDPILNMLKWLRQTVVQV